MPAKHYVVTLRPEGRVQLESLVRSGKRSARAV
jgi:hypothetical protein